jgi:hypothetical protein
MNVDGLSEAKPIVTTARTRWVSQGLNPSYGLRLVPNSWDNLALL